MGEHATAPLQFEITNRFDSSFQWNRKFRKLKIRKPHHDC